MEHLLPLALLLFIAHICFFLSCSLPLGGAQLLGCFVQHFLSALYLCFQPLQGTVCSIVLGLGNAVHLQLLQFCLGIGDTLLLALALSVQPCYDVLVINALLLVLGIYGACNLYKVIVGHAVHVHICPVPFAGKHFLLLFNHPAHLLYAVVLYVSGNVAGSLRTLQYFKHGICSRHGVGLVNRDVVLVAYLHDGLAHLLHADTAVLF